ncbi:SurA N-terminal domain-containing protein [Paracoccus caeni]|uniref:SurA N-terminal domain-containing protein n=1 Tax=Paracoccus caeni TaxID=657651 RepID=A0A934SIE7_9RHOB|nr:SurA N-terminal domain-containing protein [Paracoccus caeni]
MRTHGKSTIVWVLMGLMVLGLGGFGVTSFSSGSTAIGSVGDTKVTADEYLRALRNQINAIQQQTGQPVTMAQAREMGVPQAVRAQLFTGAALQDQANRIGVSVGDDRVRDAIGSISAFRGPNGNFDRTAYSEVLRNQQMSEAQFERMIRDEESRLLLQRAVVGGVVAPKPMVDATAHWILETRDVSWRELTADQLTNAITEPDEEKLKAWHSANADRFTAPEIRKISYVWLTPEMLAPKIELDEEALRQVYESQSDTYRKPERRFVSRLVMPSQEAAEEAKARIDAGELSFEDLVEQRGLTLEDAELGEMTAEALGNAGEAVFALQDNGVTEPIQTNLGPALFAVHAILAPVNIPFEDARDELRGEAALDRAARQLQDLSHDFEDMLAGGSSLEQVAEETEMELGQIDWVAGAAPEQGSIAGYEDFREQAAEVSEGDFPTILHLDDGGVFALRLDEIVPPTLRPFEEVRDEVAEDWKRGEVHRLLLALADEQRLQDAAAATAQLATTPPASNGAVPAQSPADLGDDDAAPEPAPAAAPNVIARDWKAAPAISRDGWIDTVPQDVVTRAFSMGDPGEIEIVDAENRVFLVRLDAVHQADLDTPDAGRISGAVTERLSGSMQGDIFDYYAREAQRLGGVEVNQSSINTVETQVQ